MPPNVLSRLGQNLPDNIHRRLLIRHRVYAQTLPAGLENPSQLNPLHRQVTSSPTEPPRRLRDAETLNSFESGLLKNLSRTKITLNKTPVAGDPRVLARHIEFQVPIEPALRTSIFDLFGFELRGIGFHLASPAFDDDPALSISRQINSPSSVTSRA